MGLRRRKWGAALLVAAWTFSAGCGARAPEAVVLPDPNVARSRADITALIARGCYQCLEEAYRKATESAVDPSSGAPGNPLAFEASLLLAARSKELGLPYEPWLERA